MDQTERSKPTRRSGLKEAAGKNITIRLPLDLYDKINSEWNKRGFKSKTDMIEHICKVYLASLPCPSCGALNPPNGVECAVCGEKLTPYYQAIEELNVVGNKVVKMITLVVSSLNALLNNIELMKKQRKQNSTDKYHIYGDILENINTMIDREKITIQLYLGLVPCFSPHDTLFDAEDYLKCCLEKMPHVKKGTQEMMSLMYSEKERLEMLVEAFGAMHKENTRFIVVTRCLTTLDEDLPTLLSELSEEYPDFIDELDKGTSTIYSKSIDDTHDQTPIMYKIMSTSPLEKRSTQPENPNIHTSIEDHYEVGHSKKQNNSHVDYLTNIAYPIRKKLDKL